MAFCILPTGGKGIGRYIRLSALWGELPRSCRLLLHFFYVYLFFSLMDAKSEIGLFFLEKLDSNIRLNGSACKQPSQSIVGTAVVCQVGASRAL